MPNFDARSFLITLLFVGVICSVVFFVLRRGFPKGIDGIGDWAWACLVVVFGAALIIARDIVPPFFGVAVSNTLVSGGILLMLTGNRKFVGAAPHYARAAMALLFFFGALLWVVWTGQDIHTRLMIVTAFNATLFFASSATIYRIKHKGFPEWFSILNFSFTALISTVRFFIGLAGDGIPVNGDQVSVVQQIYLGTFAVALISGSLGFLLMATKKLQVRLEHAASRDDLTGAYNRAAFCNLFSRELGRCARHAKPLSLLIIDVDDFKLVNDRHGHTMGDVVLRAFADLATQELRDADVFCRYGGEEFAVLLPDTMTAEALVVAERIRQSFAALALPGMVPATVSIGLMASGDGSGQMAALIEMADRALYLAKRTGKNRVVLSPEIQQFQDGSPVLT